MNMFKKLKEIFSSSPYERDYDWVCLNCGEIFDGNNPELFIKHQISSKHYEIEKRKKLE